MILFTNSDIKYQYLHYQTNTDTDTRISFQTVHIAILALTSKQIPVFASIDMYASAGMFLTVYWY